MTEQSATLLPGLQRMSYETPPGGISLTGYIVRRMHKTHLLAEVETLVETNPAEALSRFGIYATAAATSWGPALYQPTFDRPGTVVTEPDPETGAQVTVRHLPDDRHYAFSYEVSLPGGGMITGREAITGTTVGFRGLGMPAPSQFTYYSANGMYEASARGIIYSELAPRIGRWQVRGYGELDLEDNQGNTAHLALARSGKISLRLVPANQAPRLIEFQMS